jgi:hypothetical protein
VYANALHNPFVYDDYRMIVGNTSIEHLTHIRAIVWHDVSRPLVTLSYAIDYAWSGRNAVGYHVTSVALHVVNVALLFALTLALSPRDRRSVPAFTAAALLAVHPMMSESVAYLSGRAEVLCTSFFLLALLAGRRWIAATTSGRGATVRGVATIGLWLLALASKETAAVFPFVFAAYDWLSSGSDSAMHRRWRTVHIPLILLTLAAGVARLIVLARVEYPGQAAVHWSLLLVIADVVRRYLMMLIVPAGQSAYHSVAAVRSLVDLRVWTAAATLAIAAVAVWRTRRAAWAVALGLLWWFLALVPSSVLMLLGRGEPMAEHRVYLASCGLFLAIGAAFGALWIRAEQTLRRGGLLVGGALAALLIGLALETTVRNAIWRDPVTLWGESVALAPADYRPRLMLGEALQDAGRKADALAEFQTAVRLAPQQPDGYVKTGLCLISMGRLQEGRSYLVDGLARDAASEPARRGLALLDSLR